MTNFKRVFVCRLTNTVRVEVGGGEIYKLPNPTVSGKRYNPDQLLKSITTVGSINLTNWERCIDETF